MRRRGTGRSGWNGCDWLYMQAFQIALIEHNFQILELLIGLTEMMVEGELIQLERIGRIGVTETDCME
jgi:octaprenyl-diphosphate synthase